jgi:hypothetical protein
MASLATVTTKVEAQTGTPDLTPANWSKSNRPKTGSSANTGPLFSNGQGCRTKGNGLIWTKRLSLWTRLQRKAGLALVASFSRLPAAAKGREPEEGEEIDTEDLVGKRYILMVERTKKGDNSYSNIKSYAPWKRSKTRLERSGRWRYSAGAGLPAGKHLIWINRTFEKGVVFWFKATPHF